MKKLVFILLTCSFSCLCMAQEKGYRLGVAAETGPLLGDRNAVSIQRFTLSPGYSFDGRWYAALPLATACELLDNGTVKSYGISYDVGLEAGYNMVVSSRNLLNFSVSVGGTVYAETTKSLYYDIGAKWGTAARFKPLVGLGLRYYQTLGNGAKDRFCIYASIGFRFN